MADPERAVAGLLSEVGGAIGRVYIHPDGRQLVLWGKDGDDAKPYQEKQVTDLAKR